MPEFVTQSFDRIADLLDTGGPVVYLLVALSLIVTTIALIKVWQFRRAGLYGGMAKVHSAADLYRRGKTDAAITLLRNIGGIAGTVAAKSIRGMLRANVDKAEIRAEIMRIAAGHLEGLRDQLRTLEVIGALAPLLGLFGTVLGTIEAFQNLEGAGRQVDPSVLSGGIWLALLTTAVGLAVAVPTVTLHSYFERRIERLAHDLDDLIARLFTADFEAETFHKVTDADTRRRA